MVIFIRHFVGDCVHGIVGVGVYFTPIPINIIYLTVYGLKYEARGKGGNDVVGTESFGYGGDVDGGWGGRTNEGGGEDEWYEDR